MALPPNTPRCIHNSPQLKIELRTDLMKATYWKSTAKFTEELQQLIEKNTLLQHHFYEAFTYKGVFYTFMYFDPKAKAKDLYHVKKQRLDPQLYEYMEAYLRRKEEVADEMNRAATAINSVLTATTNFDDYLAFFPQFLHPLIMEWSYRCACQVPCMTDEKRQQFLAKYKDSIDVLRQRQIIYLIEP